MAGLSPILASGLRVVFCGTAVAERSASRGHYYAGPGNEFWSLLADSGLSSVRLGPSDDQLLPHHGLGLTDLAPGVTQSHDRGLKYDVSGLVESMEKWRPRFLAFTSLQGARVVAKAQGERKPDLGLQSWCVGPAQVFVLPSPSGANRRTDYSGRSTRLEWWAELSGLVG
jgi:double-stranded uracil-DNA glycosylase